MENNVSQSRSRGPNFAWNDELVRILVKILLDYQKKNGSKQSYNWKDITASFSTMCGKSGVKDVCRNNYEAMKKEYKEWNLLMNSETGLGWNDSTRMITASDEWWDRKIKEDVNCKRYRNKGMDDGYEEILRSHFFGNIATGRLAMSSTMAPETSPEHVSIAADENVGGDDDDVGGDDEFFPNFVDSCNDERVSSHSGIREDLTDMLFETTPTPTPTTVTRNTNEKAPMKRKRRQSRGASKLEEHLAHSREQGDKMIEILQGDLKNKGLEEDRLMTEGIEMLDRFVEKNLVEDDSPFWCFILSKTRVAQDMRLLEKVVDDEKKVKWLKWEFDNR